MGKPLEEIPYLIFTVQGRHGEFELGKAQYSTPIFLTCSFFQEHIETQNLGKAQGLGGLTSRGSPEIGKQKNLTLNIYRRF